MSWYWWLCHLLFLSNSHFHSLFVDYMTIDPQSCHWILHDAHKTIYDMIWYVMGKLGICLHYYYAVHDECKYSNTVWFADGTRLFVQYTISLSSLCKLIWRHWTYKMLVRYIVSSVWLRLSILSPLSNIQYVGLYVFSLPINLVMIESIYILSYYHHQIGSMNYYPLFGVRSWNNGICCMSIYILMIWYDTTRHDTIRQYDI